MSYIHDTEELIKNLEIREPQGDEIWSPTPRAHDSHLLTTVEPIPLSTETNLTKPKRGRLRKRTSENQLIVDGQFELPSPIKSSTEITLANTSFPSSAAVTTVSSTTVVPSAHSASQLTIIQATQQRDQTPLAITTSDPAESPLRRSLRKRPHTPQASVSKQTKPLQLQKATSRTCVLSLARCRESKQLTNPVQQECRGVIDWSVDDVVDFVASIPRCSNCSLIFREHVSVICNHALILG